MPEAAETKLTVDFLNRVLKNQPISDVTINSGRFIKKHPKGWRDLLMEWFHPEIKVTEINCKGKFIWGKIQFAPDSFQYFTCSLAMSGSWTDQNVKHNHFTFHLRNGTKVHFNDPRRFGTIAFYKNFNDIQKQLDKLGVNFFVPLTHGFVFEICSGYLFARIEKSKHKQVCEILLDQSIFCGVGNYIKNEALFKAQIHPATLWKDLNETQINKLWCECHHIINRAYKLGGASFKTFKDSNGELSGKYQTEFKIYGKQTLEDGSPVSKGIFKDGRTSFYDPRVQIINN